MDRCVFHGRDPFDQSPFCSSLQRFAADFNAKCRMSGVQALAHELRLRGPSIDTGDRALPDTQPHSKTIIRRLTVPQARD